jgi:signal transduction histidine kinase
MGRGSFRHTLLILIVAGLAATGLLAWSVWPEAWRAILACCAGAFVTAFACERVALWYLRRTVGGLRRQVDALSKRADAAGGHGLAYGVGAGVGPPDAHPGDDFYKLVRSIGELARRLEHSQAEEQRLEVELRRKERLAFLGELAASVAHEVNNPLDGIQNCARILRRNLGDPQRAGQMLDHIDSGAQRIELIVRRLLTLARHNSIRPVETPIAAVVASAVQQVRAKAEQAGVVLQAPPGESSARALVDPLLMEQVFANLLLNAIDSTAGPASGGAAAGDPAAAGLSEKRVAVTVRIESGDRKRGSGGPQIVVAVRDTGPGVPADIRSHIFEPFFTTKRDGRGTGLGLAIAARIVDAHRGSIELRDEAGDGVAPLGACFEVRLPVAG